jgi:glycosidase
MAVTSNWNTIYNAFAVNQQAPQQKLVQAQVQPQQPAQNYQYAAGYAPVMNAQLASTITISNPVKANQPQGLLDKLINVNSTEGVASSNASSAGTVAWNPHLRQTFKENKAVIYAMIMRTFNAKDKDGDALIDLDKGEETGTFNNAVERLDELKKYGVNTIHMLPIHPPGKKQALGTAGSVYAPADMQEIDPILDDKNDPRSVKEEAKAFVDECHKRGISVMIDLPSCFAVDMYEKRPELAAIDSKGFPKVPQGWNDIRMMEPWADEDKRILNKALMDEHKKWIDLVQEIGVDGVRADVGRAKPVEFWNELIPYSRGETADSQKDINKYPQRNKNFAWLAETYVYEDASPMQNMPFDRPKDLLKVGFDSIYGQYHIFPLMEKAKDMHGYVKEYLQMSHEFEPGKSIIGSFATHDDNSPMSNGGAPYCNMTTGLQMTLPMVNPYFVTGFESGDRYIYPYKDKKTDKTMTDSNVLHVNPQWVDIFNLSRKPGGDHPEIGDYISSMSKVRKQYEDVITKGSYIPLEVQNNKDDKIIAYARHYNGKTLLAVANKDVNSKQTGKIMVPGLSPMQPLKDLCPSYGVLSGYSSRNDAVEFNLGPARFHLFEINTPNIEKDAKEVYKQNL